MQHWIKYLIVLCYLLSGCHKDEHGITSVPEPVPVPEPKRTVLVYMIADNSLNKWVDDNLNKMMRNYDGHENLVAYVDGYNGAPRLVKLVMYDDGLVREDTVRVYEERNSASPEVLRQTIEEVCAEFPTESYGLLLWSHGTSWLPSDGRTRAFGQDGGDWMELNDLAAAIPDRRFDFILFDACYMASIEVAYALRNKTNYMISSPTEVVEDGFPYNDIVSSFWGGEEDYRKICGKFFAYYDSQAGMKRSATISLVKTEGLERLAGATRNIIQGKEEQIAGLDLSGIQCVDRRGSLYWYDVLYDFDDFISHMSPTDEQYEEFGDALDKVILFEAHTPSFFGEVYYRKFCGLSCYIPQSSHPGLNAFYDDLDWKKAVYGQSE